MLKVGDYVTRKKYNNDILFKIVKIEKEKIILRGVELRLYADSKIDDLVLKTKSKKKEEFKSVRNLDYSDYFYIPGVIVHFDSDQNYLDMCLDYYKNEKIKCYGFIFNESDYAINIEKIIRKYKPNIVVITGHDAYYKKTNSYKNSKNFIDTVKKIRNYNSSLNELIIISGACQSDFESLIKSGSNFASSPGRINIHALDPAKVAVYVAKTNVCDFINLDEILSKTEFGKLGIGGIMTNGVMFSGTPRKDKN